MAYGTGKQCTAKSKRTGKRCKANCITGKDVCYHHGGKSLGGYASPSLKEGLYSRYLPVVLSAQYENLLTLGQDLFRIDNETAVVTALIQQQLDKIESGESEAAWQKLSDMYEKLSTLAQKSNKTDGDIQTFNALFVKMGDVINSGSMSFASRNEAISLVEQKRKMVADERKDWANKHQAMTFDRVMLIMTAMVASFKKSLEKHILDDNDRRAVLVDSQKFLDRVISE